MVANVSQISERTRRLSWIVVILILIAFAAAPLLLTRYFRGALVANVIQQYGVALGGALMVSRLPDELKSDSDLILMGLFGNVLEVGQQSDEVFGVRLFDHTGALMDTIGGLDTELSAEQIEKLKKGETISWFEPSVRLRDIVTYDTDTRAPVIWAILPLEHEGTFLGAAEFILDGQEAAKALRDLDRNLWLYSGLVFLLGGGVTAAAVLWAFRRLERANQLLAERTRSLLRANHELTLATKTSAIGAITAHLIHDLKNPLFGLQSFVSARGSTEEEDWNIAQNTTERMQKVIGEIVRILQEEKTTEQYELSISELLSLLREKLQPQCSSAGISFRTEGRASGSLMNRDANIILLVITNIVQNAIQATPRGGEISVAVSAGKESLLFTMRDTGPGLPDHVRSSLFTPSRSTKSNGSGLGLAISKQLANHIGAELILKETSRAGTVFELRVPDRILMSAMVAETV